MWKTYIIEVEKERKKYNGKMQPPATQESINNLIKRAKNELKIKLPETYLEFLRIVNGLVENNITIYGTEPLPYASTSGELGGLVEENEEWRDVEAHKAYVFYAQSSQSIFGLKLATGEYVEVDRYSGDEFERYKNFEEMLISLLKKSLG